jgi:hypothetical protein
MPTFGGCFRTRKRSSGVWTFLSTTPGFSDIAQVVSFVVSDEAGWITGDTIQAGGGVAM